MVSLFFWVLKVSALVNSNEIIYVDTCFESDNRNDHYVEQCSL